MAVKTATRFYVPDALASGIVVSLSDAQSHQLRHVLRLESGATIALFNGNDGEWIGTATIEKRSTSVKVTDQARLQTPAPNIWLLFAPLKQDRTIMLVEKAVELGAARLVPIITARTQGSNKINAEKLGHVVREAAEQCERLDVPIIEIPQKLETVLQSWDAGRPLFVCAERGEALPVLDAFQNTKAAAAILIGPEGGFTDAEFALLRAQAFAHFITLCPTILRAETAAIAALSCWQATRKNQ